MPCGRRSIAVRHFSGSADRLCRPTLLHEFTTPGRYTGKSVAPNKSMRRHRAKKPPESPWAPTGWTPILRRVSKRREVSTAVALTLSGRIYKRHFDHAVHGPDVVVFLRHLQRYLPGPLMVHTN